MTAILDLVALRKAFGGIIALNDLTLTISEPGIYGLIGPNGAGKTTLFDVICGLQMADAGAILFEGLPIEKSRVHVRAGLGFSRTFQECRVLPEETCLDNVLFAAQKKPLGAEFWQMITPGIESEGCGHDRSSAPARIGEILPTMPTCLRQNYLLVSAAFWKLSRRWWCARKSCCLTNRLPVSIQRCSTRCAISFAACTNNTKSSF